MADNDTSKDSSEERRSTTTGGGPLRGLSSRGGGPSGTGGPHLRRGRGASTPTPVDQELLRKLDREEPLSIAEELEKAAERVRRSGGAIAKATEPDQNAHIAALQQLAPQELLELAEAEGVEEAAGLKKQDLIFKHPQVSA